MIKTVLWDLDSTLLDPKIPQRVAIKKCFELFGFGVCTEEQLDMFPPINDKYWEKLNNGTMTKEELTTARFAEFLQFCGKDSTVARDFNLLYMKKHGETVCPCPNAFETVKALQGKVSQYIATNGLVVAQQGKIDFCGLDKLIDRAFISETVGFDKPNKEFYDYILNQIGVTDRKTVMMVGDSLTTDMQGAINAGLVSCWYNPNHKVNDSGLKLDYEISDLSQILSIC